MERNALVDRLKGYACFLVLFGHLTAIIAKKVRFLNFFFFPTKAFTKK